MLVDTVWGPLHNAGWHSTWCWLTQYGGHYIMLDDTVWEPLHNAGWHSMGATTWFWLTQYGSHYMMLVDTVWGPLCDAGWHGIGSHYMMLVAPPPHPHTPGPVPAKDCKDIYVHYYDIMLASLRHHLECHAFARKHYEPGHWWILFFTGDYWFYFMSSDQESINQLRVSQNIKICMYLRTKLQVICGGKNTKTIELSSVSCGMTHMIQYYVILANVLLVGCYFLPYLWTLKFGGKL